MNVHRELVSTSIRAPVINAQINNNVVLDAYKLKKKKTSKQRENENVNDVRIRSNNEAARVNSEDVSSRSATMTINTCDLK